MVKMRKILALLLALLTLGVLPLMSWGDGIETQAKSLILVEGSTGKVLYELNADESLPPASVTKIMTLLLVFEAIEERTGGQDGRFAGVSGAGRANDR